MGTSMGHTRGSRGSSAASQETRANLRIHWVPQGNTTPATPASQALMADRYFSSKALLRILPQRHLGEDGLAKHKGS